MTRKKAYIIQSSLTIICAALLVLVPLSWMFARRSDFLNLEKRYREKWPDFNADMLFSGDWGRRVDAWMADNMPAREILTGLYSYSKYFTGSQNAQEIIVDGGGRLLESPPRFSENDLTRRLDKIAGFSESFESDALLVIPPTAGHSSKTGLPDYVWRCYHDDELFDIVKSFSAVDNSRAFGFVDLRGAFLSAPTPLFYRTDHHWNADGVYLAYAHICEALGKAPLPADAFTVAKSDGFYGANYALSGLWLTRPDVIEMWTPPCEVRVSIWDGMETDDGGEMKIAGADVFDSMFFTEHLSERDKYPVFLDGNHALTLIENLSAAPSDASAAADTSSDASAAVETSSEISAGTAVDTSSAAEDAIPAAPSGTLLVVKDSYGNSLIPLLIPHYEKIVVVDLRYYRTPVSELARDIGLPEGGYAVLIVYSVNHIVNDPDIMWLR